MGSERNIQLAGVSLERLKKKVPGQRWRWGQDDTQKLAIKRKGWRQQWRIVLVMKGLICKKLRFTEAFHKQLWRCPKKAHQWPGSGGLLETFTHLEGSAMGCNVHPFLWESNGLGPGGVVVKAGPIGSGADIISAVKTPQMCRQYFNLHDHIIRKKCKWTMKQTATKSLPDLIQSSRATSRVFESEHCWL